MPLFGSSSKSVSNNITTDNRVAADAGALVARADGAGSVVNVDMMGDEALDLGLAALDFSTNSNRAALQFADYANMGALDTARAAYGVAADIQAKAMDQVALAHDRESLALSTALSDSMAAQADDGKEVILAAIAAATFAFGAWAIFRS